MALPKYDGHRPAYMAAIILACMAFAGTMLFSYLAMELSRGDNDNKIFVSEDIFSKNGTDEDRNYLEITPASAAFSIWGFIYAYQAVFLVYALTTICRKTSAGYLYATPPLLPPIIFLVYIFNLGANISWLFTADRDALHYGLFVIALLPSTLYLCMGISMWRLHQYAPDFIAEGRKTELKLVIGLVHNAMGLYAGWATIATLLNLAIVLTYYLPEPVPQHVSSSISLAILALEVVVYTVLDHVLMEKYLRHLYTPYIALHFALIGSVIKNWNAQNSNFIFTMGLLVIGCFLTIFKIARSIYMEKTKPLFGDEDEKKKALFTA